jgi:hypothetical protein
LASTSRKSQVHSRWSNTPLPISRTIQEFMDAQIGATEGG